MSNIIFFIRSFNDFDQALPLIDYLSSKNMKILVCSFSLELDGCDKHINYLENEIGIKIIYFSNILSKPGRVIISLHSRLMFVISKAKRNSYLLLFSIASSYVLKILNNLYGSAIGTILKQLNPNKIIMDNGAELSFHGKGIIDFARKESIPVICYSHGYSIYSNQNPLTKDKNNIGFLKSTIIRLAPFTKKRIYADCYLTGPKQKDTYFTTPGMSGKYDPTKLYKVHEIGMPRYTYEWCTKYRNMILKEESFTYGDSNKLNVVLYMTHPKYSVNLRELYKLIERLSSLNFINFVYKPHTRTGLEMINKNMLNGFDAGDVNSILLSEWADISVIYGSSISFQLLIDRTPIVIPTFVHSNTTILEDNDVCIKSNSLDELVNTLVEYSNRNYIDHQNDKTIESFIKEYMYGNKNHDQMMQQYCDSIKNCTKDRNTFN